MWFLLGMALVPEYTVGCHVGMMLDKGWGSSDNGMLLAWHVHWHVLCGINTNLGFCIMSHPSCAVNSLPDHIWLSKVTIAFYQPYQPKQEGDSCACSTVL